MPKEKPPQMKRIIFTFLTVISLLLLPSVNGAFGLPKAHLRPLSSSQITLVSYASASLPLPPPPSLSSTVFFPDDEEHRHRHRHRRRHQHRHRSSHQQSPAEHNCCRWLNDMDDECVCDLLAHLPIFL